MSIQVTLSFNTEAEMLAYFAGKGAAPAATTSAKADKPAATTKAEPPKPKHSREEMEAALGKVKDASDAKTAKAIIAEVGGAAKMADIADDKIDAVFDAAEKKLTELQEQM